MRKSSDNGITFRKKMKQRINIMNRNTIISLAMLYALWQSKRQDLLDLIQR